MTRLRRRAAASFRPILEMLEVRNLLSTYTVDHLADDMVGDALNGSLRYCLTNATDRDDIQFAVTGTINLTGPLPVLTHSIGIEGPGADQLTVREDMGGGNSTFVVDSGTTVGMAGLTISNGYGTAVGIANSGTLTLTNATVSGNYGRGISNSGTLTLTNATVSGNPDGGIYNSGNLTLTNAAVSDNGHGVGSGGIFNSGTLTLTNSAVRCNTDCGIRNYGTVRLEDSTVSGNSTLPGLDVPGGIINGGTLTLTNTTVSGNFGGRGGGIGTLGSSNGVTLTLNNSTISGNSATEVGGGIYIEYIGSVTIHARNTIIAGNTAPGEPDLYADIGSLGHNLIGTTQGGSGFDPTDLLNVDPLLGPLQDNGGPTQTMALLAGSPALNAGDVNQLGTTDQRGVVRGGGVNIGAYQASASAFLLNAPHRVQAGVPFDMAVTAVDPFGQLAVGYIGTVTFSTSDPDTGVVLPADYTFTLDNGGVHTFADTGLGETTLLTHGHQTITATDSADGSITGAVTVRVRRTPPVPGPAPHHGDVVWLPARSIHPGFGDNETSGWDWLDRADL
jgi:hypothetical protein